MRRAVLTLGGTVAGLAALFSYKTHVPGVAAATTPAAAAGTSTGQPVSDPMMTRSKGAASPSASPSESATQKEAAPKAAPATTPAIAPPTTAPAPVTPTAAAPSPTPSKKPTPAPTTPPPRTTAPAAPSGTYTGPDESAGQYGEVQVQITVSDGKITAANDLQPTDDSIGANAVSQLNSEVVDDQSGNVNAVSGATYTSNAYLESLQQAIDSAGL